MEDTIRQAEKQDIKKLESFLVEANLSCDGLEDSIEYYSLLETKNGALKACIGIEPVAGVGLLRSFVLSPATTQVQIMLLFDRVIRIAESGKLRALYLVTDKQPAMAFFNKVGFEQVDDYPMELNQHSHFQQVVNVDNSIVMEMLVGVVDNF